MQLDDRIRQALVDDAASIGQDALARLRAIDYKPRSHTLPTRLVAVVAVGAAAGAGTLLAIGSAGTQAAFAGWHATPTRASATRTAAVEARCASRLRTSSRNGGKGSTVPEVADTRGPYTLVVYDELTCFAGPGFVGLHGVQAADGISISTGFRGDQPFTISAGPVPADATAVGLTLQDGNSVQATVGNSRFAAWWPSVSRPASISITTPSGTHRQPLDYAPAPAPKPTKTARKTNGA
jgi:hypothetical protein